MKDRQVSFFPAPYPDELLYSVCARYHFRSGNLRREVTNDHLFGYPNLHVNIWMPHRLDVLVSRLPLKIFTVDALIENNTMLPYFEPFLANSRVDDAVEQMRSENTPKWENATRHAGLIGSSIKHAVNLRFCPECLEEDYETFGEPYWHRSHQALGVYRCHRHKCWLHESAKHSGGRYEYVRLHKGIDSLGPCLSEENDSMAHHEWFAETAHWLLNDFKGARGLTPHIIKDRYQGLLKKHGLTVGICERVNNKLFLEKLLDFYGHDFLERFHCPVHLTERYNKLFRLFNKAHVISNPVYHLLVIRFLGVGIDEILRNEVCLVNQRLPFGTAPWPCLNPVAGHYRQEVVETCQTSPGVHAETVKAEFTCSCGFVYERTGPDKSLDSRFRYDRILETGDIWNGELIRLAGNGHNLTSISRGMGASLGLIYRQVGKLFTYPCGIPNIDKFLEKRESARRQWLELKSAFPDWSLNELIEYSSSLYLKITNYDRDWYNKNKPEKGKQMKQRVNWEDRDVQFENEILAAADTMNAQGKGISFASIHRELSKRSLITRSVITHYLNRLPRSKAALSKVIGEWKQAKRGA